MYLVHVAKIVLQNKRVKKFWILNSQILIKIVQISVNDDESRMY